MRPCRGGVRVGPELAEALELVHELVQDVEGPLRQKVQPVPSSSSCSSSASVSLHLDLGQQRIKQPRVHVPPGDAIGHAGPAKAVEMAGGQLGVQGQEEGIAAALAGDGPGRGPGGLVEVLLGQVGEGVAVQGRLLGREVGPPGAVVQVEDKVLEGAGKARVVRVGGGAAAHGCLLVGCCCSSWLLVLTLSHTLPLTLCLPKLLAICHHLTIGRPSIRL